jgi:hypothetical protein
MGQPCFLTTFLTWSARRWAAAVAAGLATFLALGATTAVIPNPVFGRSIPPTDWAMGILVLTSVLSGLLVATYIRNTGPAPLRGQVIDPLPGERTARGGVIGGALAYFAIGCPVCNKLVLIALGSTGAVQFFAPVQPYLAVLGVVVLAWALLVRLRGELVCALGTRSIDESHDEVEANT